ncbi:MAG: hypothetical protein PWQ96_1961 [Clostridia bacterium]|jgi:putative AlgH/UPF0301 family transcriptional regulator|nr:hypothetical protein [Clostridiales bacterium]MDK2986317.1 hypothetical protein [Clostridia bacterium]
MPRLKAEDYIDKKAIEKKLGIDLNVIIKAWKNGKRDSEISAALGISEWKLSQLRAELQHCHYMARINKRKEEGKI